MFDAKQIRKDFPILDRKVGGRSLVYLDNAATSQKPASVIAALTDYYERYNSNIHRGLHTLSEEATEAYEAVRGQVAAFIGAREDRGVIFTRNATEAINLVASSWGRTNLLAGDEIVLTPMEHHSNIVPWQVLAAERDARIVFIELTAEGEIDMESARKAIGPKTKLVAMTQMSNVLGTITPVAEVAALAHKQGAVVLVDGAQGVPHLPTAVAEMGADFLAFSFHKMLGPTGVGVLWGRPELLEAMPPFLYGGDMISAVWRDRSRWNELPWKFEAGTPNVADVIAAGLAIEYLSGLGMAAVRAHEIELTAYALERLQSVEEVIVYGPRDATRRGGVISFNIAEVHPHDIGQILNEYGIAIRAGHHCCQPLMRDLDLAGTARASFYVYNTREEVDLLIESVKEARKVMGHVAYR